MNVMLDIKNGSMLKNPKDNHIILFDGEKWYVTTREKVFAEYEKKVDTKLKEIVERQQTMEKELVLFKSQVSNDILEMSQIVKILYGKKE